jgi:L-ascorbate metabolism protein UlaG (beta-lactamase superfamily)
MSHGHTTLQLLGHATFKIITPEQKIILVDPWLFGNPYIPPGLEQQPAVDLLLITHGHEDHMDIRLKEFVQQTRPTIIANNICRRFLLEQAVDESLFEPMNLGGSLPVQGVTVTMVQAFHHAHVYLTEKTVSFPHAANGFIVGLSDGTTIYFAGDTCVFGDMQLIRELYQPTIAVLPIGGRSMMGALEAAHAVKLLQVGHVIPFHYGTAPEHTQTPDEFVARTQAYSSTRIHLLRAGDVFDCHSFTTGGPQACYG